MRWSKEGSLTPNLLPHSNGIKEQEYIAVVVHDCEAKKKVVVPSFKYSLQSRQSHHKTLEDIDFSHEVP